MSVYDLPEEEVGKKVANVRCPQCKKPFKLRWQETGGYGGKPYIYATVCIRYCPSGGIYGCCIKCPHCNYEEEI